MLHHYMPERPAAIGIAEDTPFGLVFLEAGVNGGSPVSFDRLFEVASKVLILLKKKYAQRITAGGVVRVCLARLGTLNIPSRPARRSLGEVGRAGLIIGRRFSAGLEFGHFLAPKA